MYLQILGLNRIVNSELWRFYFLRKSVDYYVRIGIRFLSQQLSESDLKQSTGSTEDILYTSLLTMPNRYYIFGINIKPYDQINVSKICSQFIFFPLFYFPQYAIASPNIHFDRISNIKLCNCLKCNVLLKSSESNRLTSNRNVTQSTSSKQSFPLDKNKYFPTKCSVLKIYRYFFFFVHKFCI